MTVQVLGFFSIVSGRIAVWILVHFDICHAPYKAHLTCRIPLSSCHPQIPTWCLNKPRLLIMNRADMVSQQDQQDWSNYYGRQGLSLYYTDANAGKGITKVLLPIVESLMELHSQEITRKNNCPCWRPCCLDRKKRTGCHFNLLWTGLIPYTLYLTLLECPATVCQSFPLACNKINATIVRVTSGIAHVNMVVVF